MLHFIINPNNTLLHKKLHHNYSFKTQIQNVSKLTANNINITSSDNLNIQSAYIQALNNVSLTSTNGSINLTQNSSTANADHTSDITNYSSQTVANVIETGSTDSTFLLIQKQHNNQQLAQLKIQLSGGKDVKSQIDQLTQSNTQIDQQLKQNANQGSITINSAKDVNILASQNITNNHSSYNKTNMMYSIHDNHNLQIATTVSPLLSSNNITINADGGNGNINLLSAILTGQGDLNLNGNVNMQSLQDQYYSYDFSQATSMNLGALLGMLLAAVVIGAVTGGAGALALGAIGAATVSVGTAVVGAAIASSVGVGLQLGITAAIDAKNGGAAATQDMQSGHMDSTTKQYQGLVGNSLLFGGNINTNVSNTSVDSSTNISSNNMNQTGDKQESASYQEEHKTIGPDWNQLMTDAAINGVVSGVTVAAGPLIEAGVSKLGSFVSKSFGFTDEATEFAATTMTKDEIIQAGMNNVTAEKPIANSIDNLTVDSAKATKSVDKTVDILGELGKKALPDPMNGMSKIVDKAMPDMSLVKDVGSLGKNVGSVLDAGIAEPFFKLPGSSPKAYIFDNPAVMGGAAVGGKIGGMMGKVTLLPFGSGFSYIGQFGGTYYGTKIGISVTEALLNIGTKTTKTFTLEELNNINNLLKL